MNTSITPNSNTSQSTSSERLSTPQAETSTPPQTFNPLLSDIVSISEQATDLQRLPEEAPSSVRERTAERGDEVVRVSSSIGQSSAQGKLNTDQASKLYNEIAALL